MEAATGRWRWLAAGWEEDYLAYPFSMPPTAHYRFDASQVPSEVLR